jgi:fructose-specific phosphotransferase system IIA component
MKLLDYLDPALIDLHLQGHTKEQILGNLVGLLAAHGRIQRRDALLEALLEREGLGSTGIGHGVAIPHGRCGDLSQPAIAFARSEQEVDFDSIDGLPTRIFFLLVVPENGSNEHLHLLAKIARLMRDAATRERLLAMDSTEQVLELFGAQESA